jgi:hypothetical protein
MTGLERKAHRLVELARAGDDPSAAQLLSLHGAVAARIAAEGAIAASGATSSAKAATAGALVKGLVALGAIATGAASFFALQGSAEPVPAPAPMAHVSAPRPPPVARVDARPAEAAPSREAAPPPNRVSKPPSGLRLQEEAAALADVQSVLRSGRAALALSKLEGYDRRFPTGMLRSEADAARVFALCAAGQVDKARAAAQRFVQRYPNAPATARVQSACK